MFSWIMANLSTIVISLALLGVVALIVAAMVRRKKAGGSSCGCGCSDCAMSGLCGEKNDQISDNV